MKRILFILAVLLTVTPATRAQNQIDNLVNTFSAVSSSKYTSAVERNPKTRAIVKVVKMLEMEYANVTPLVNAFRSAASEGNFSERKEGSALTMTLGISTARQNRIYMLRVPEYYDPCCRNGAYKTACSVTVVVKNK